MEQAPSAGHEIVPEDRSQYRFKINVRTGILNGKVIGPYELPKVLNGEVYLNFLQNDLPNLLEDVSLGTYRDIWFQQDGCAAYYAVAVSEYLEEKYPGRWIGSPFTGFQSIRFFFYREGVREKVYSKSIENLAELRHRLMEADEFVTTGRFARQITRSFLGRCRACIAAEERQFEHLL